MERNWCFVFTFFFNLFIGISPASELRLDDCGACQFQCFSGLVVLCCALHHVLGVGLISLSLQGLFGVFPVFRFPSSHQYPKDESISLFSEIFSFRFPVKHSPFPIDALRLRVYLLWYVCSRGPFPPYLSSAPYSTIFPSIAWAPAPRFPVACPVGPEPLLCAIVKDANGV